MGLLPNISKYEFITQALIRRHIRRKTSKIITLKMKSNQNILVQCAKNSFCILRSRWEWKRNRRKCTAQTLDRWLNSMQHTITTQVIYQNIHIVAKDAHQESSTITNKTENKRKSKVFWKFVLFHYRSTYLGTNSNTEYPEMAGESLFHWRLSAAIKFSLTVSTAILIYSH